VRIDEQVSDHDEKKKFTGYELDDESGLYYAQARYYGSDIGRFVSVDPMPFNSPEKMLDDPQALNLYAYSRNNPLRYVDVTGELYAFAESLNRLRNTSDSVNRQISSELQGVSKAFKTMLDHTPLTNIHAVADGTNFMGEEANRVDAAVWLGIDIMTLGEGSAAVKGADIAADTGAQITKGILKAYSKSNASPYATDGGLIKGVIEGSKVIANGVDGSLRQASRLASEYGGKAEQWTKNVTSGVFTSPSGIKYQPHFYTNKVTREVVELKSKIIKK
ncbi:MAG: hypothetical protein COU35_03660, partial [Candidatus Magasanikbacteria bacterium CG10_big_fil_rev_8_21_14_0_10_47_10]